MNDPVTAIFNAIFHFINWLLCKAVDTTKHHIITEVIPASNATPAVLSKPQLDENARQSGCRDVVLSYANHFGYIAREVISRTELERKIDSGISPQDLANEIHDRIDAYPGVYLGTQTYIHYPIKLPYSYRSRHMLVIGRSGSGKTNMLRQAIVADIENGCGVGVLAPEMELITEEILPYIPQDRIDDVVYINPADTEFPVAINPLHLHNAAEIDRVVDDLITVFQRLTNDITPRMREILYHTFYALVERKESTLLDVEILLDRTDDSLRNEIILTTDNPRTARFFERTFPTLSRDAYLPIHSRIGQLISPKYVRSLLCQPGKSFNFREAMDEGKILLVNLSDGILGEQTAQILGQLIISQIQIAVLSRANIPANARRPFYLYLDEFPTFINGDATSYAKLLARSRKYSFGLTLAMQQSLQIPNNLLQEILGNVSTLLAFQLSATDESRLSKEFGQRLPPDAFDNLQIGQAWGKIGTTVFPLQTALADQQPNVIRVKEIIEASRLNYGLFDSEPPQPKPKNLRSFPIVPDDDEDFDPGKVF